MRYIVQATVTISIHTVVEAASKKEALELAADRPMMTLCTGCADEDGADQEWRTGGELDGAPSDMQAVVIR